MITFKNFNSIQDAAPLLDLLEANEIEYQIEDISPSIDVAFAGTSPTDNNVAIKIYSTDFTRVEQILEKAAKADVEGIDESYYLYEFDDNELIDIIENFNEWSSTDFILAQKILKDRGKGFSEDDIKKLKNRKIEELSKPEKGSRGWLIFGYISAIFGGVFGVLIGYHHYKFKKRIPNGERVYAYDFKTRRTGFRIFIIGIISMFFWIIIRFLDFI